MASNLPRLLPQDPSEVFEINEKYRRDDLREGVDLWTADELSELSRDYMFPVPTVLSQSSILKKTLPSTKEYTEIFERAFPGVSKVLVPGRVVVAGGAAAWPFTQSSEKPGDIDFFLIGLDPSDERSLWRELGKLSETIFGVALENTEVDYVPYHSTLSPGVLTILIGGTEDPYGDPKITAKYQVILRTYPTVSALLHAFDMGSSAVAFDGENVYMTTLGAYAQAYKVNLVNPIYRSTTYEQRLVKYFHRGYALGLPHLHMESIQEKTTLVLPHMLIDIEHVYGHGIIGSVEVPKTPSVTPSDADDASNKSDYEPKLWGFNETKWSSCYYNISQLVQSKRRYILQHSLQRWDYDDADEGSERRKIPFLKFAAEGSPTLEAILPRADLDSAFVQIAKYCGSELSFWERRSKVYMNPRTLFSLLGMELAEIAQLAVVMAAASRDFRGDVDIRPALEPFAERVMAKYEHEKSDPIDWWITQDPGRQYTASMNPRMENPSEWYGAHYFDGQRSLDSDTCLKTLAGILYSGSNSDNAAVDQAVDASKCPICLDEVKPGNDGVATLSCGHSIHVWVPNKCEGVYRLASGDISSAQCPICRRPLQDKVSTVSAHRPIRVEKRIVIAEVAETDITSSRFRVETISPGSDC